MSLSRCNRAFGCWNDYSILLATVYLNLIWEYFLFPFNWLSIFLMSWSPINTKTKDMSDEHHLYLRLRSNKHYTHTHTPFNLTFDRSRMRLMTLSFGNKMKLLGVKSGLVIADLFCFVRPNFPVLSSSSLSLIRIRYSKSFRVEKTY